MSGASYEWTNGSSTSNGTSATYSATEAGSYTVKVTDVIGNQCSAVSAIHNVTIDQLPTATISGNTSFCSGSAVILTASTLSGASYEWTNGSSTLSSNQIYSATASGSYTVKITDVNGCSNISAPQVVTENQLPTATITTSNGSNIFCQGSSVTLTASNLSGASYEWKNGSSTLGSSIAEIINVSGSYTVKVTDGNGCSSISSPTSIIVNSLPTATITANGNTTFCQGSSVTLTASTLTGTDYQWANGTSNLGTSIDEIITGSGSYTVKVTDANQCSIVSSPIVVTVNPNITPTFTGLSVCSGLTASLPTTSNNSIIGSWTPTFIPISVATDYTFLPSANQCVTSTPVVLTVGINPLPIVSITASGNTAICEGSSIKLTASTGITYEWKKDAVNLGTSSTQTVTDAGNYTVKVTDSKGCSTISAPTITTVIPGVLPLFSSAVTSPKAICSGTIASLTTTSNNSIVGIWTPTFSSITAPTEYTFTATSVGCYKTVKVTVPIKAKVVPTFTINEIICRGSLELSLDPISSNQIEGTWSDGTPGSSVTTISSVKVGVFVYTFTPTPDFCASTYSTSVIVSSCGEEAGLKENIVSPYTIFPNPSDDIISISLSELSSKKGSIKLISADGKLIETREYVNSSIETFDVKSLNPGIYFLHIDNSIEKVIVK